MKKEFCIVHANCQGEPLARLLLKSPDFKSRYRVRTYTNYTREPIPEMELSSCGLLLYQHLDEKWGELASGVLLKKIPDQAAALCIPNMFFKGYWPLWSGEPGFDYRDILLDRLLDQGLGKTEILHLYLRTELAAKYDLERLFTESLDHERNKESHTPVKYVDLILDRYKGEMLFNTVNHPGPMLMAHAASEVLEALGLDSSVLKEETADDLFPEIKLPIHPLVAGRLGLDFGGPGTRYEVYGKERTFEEYAEAYVDCRMLGVDDFIGYLRLR